MTSVGSSEKVIINDQKDYASCGSMSESIPPQPGDRTILYCLFAEGKSQVKVQSIRRQIIALSRNRTGQVKAIPTAISFDETEALSLSIPVATSKTIYNVACLPKKRSNKR
jgi:hypothetical protein